MFKPSFIRRTLNEEELIDLEKWICDNFDSKTLNFIKEDIRRNKWFQSACHNYIITSPVDYIYNYVLGESRHVFDIDLVDKLYTYKSFQGVFRSPNLLTRETGQNYWRWFNKRQIDLTTLKIILENGLHEDYQKEFVKLMCNEYLLLDKDMFNLALTYGFNINHFLKCNVKLYPYDTEHFNGINYIEYIIQCGGNVNALDKHGQSYLYKHIYRFAQYDSFEEEEYYIRWTNKILELVELYLRYGYCKSMLLFNNWYHPIGKFFRNKPVITKLPFKGKLEELLTQY